MIVLIAAACQHELFDFHNPQPLDGCWCVLFQSSDYFLQPRSLNIFTCDSIYAIARICHGNSVCPSVHPSVTRVDQSKTVEARITQFSPYPHPSSFSEVSFIEKF